LQYQLITSCICMRIQTSVLNFTILHILAYSPYLKFILSFAIGYEVGGRVFLVSSMSMVSVASAVERCMVLSRSYLKK
jgi:hypothetical protein